MWDFHSFMKYFNLTHSARLNTATGKVWKRRQWQSMYQLKSSWISNPIKYINTWNPALLFNVPSSLVSVIFLSFSNAVAHIQFCYQFQAQREVTEGACQSDKLSPKWWQIGCLSARLPIKTRPSLLARTVPVNGDRWRSGEAELSPTKSVLCHCHVDPRAASGKLNLSGF